MRRVWPVRRVSPRLCATCLLRHALGPAFLLLFVDTCLSLPISAQFHRIDIPLLLLLRVATSGLGRCHWGKVVRLSLPSIGLRLIACSGHGLLSLLPALAPCSRPIPAMGHFGGLLFIGNLFLVNDGFLDTARKHSPLADTNSQ